MNYVLAGVQILNNNIIIRNYMTYHLKQTNGGFIPPVNKYKTALLRHSPKFCKELFSVCEINQSHSEENTGYL